MSDTPTEQSITIEQVEAMLALHNQPSEPWVPFPGDPAATWQYWSPVWDRAGEPVREEWIWKRLRLRRNQMLSECDYRVVADAPWDTAPWEAYRQALRDLPDNTTDPRLAVWPEPPA